MKHYREQVDLLLRLHRLGIRERILLSQDTGWYNVGQPGGGMIHPYHHLFTDFLPAAASDGVDASWLNECVTSHAFLAMSRRG
jgi:phosphotriesterase-related protein